MEGCAARMRDRWQCAGAGLRQRAGARVVRGDSWVCVCRGRFAGGVAGGVAGVCGYAVINQLRADSINTQKSGCIRRRDRRAIG